MDEVDFARIRQKKVREFVLLYGLHKVNGFSNIRPACYDITKTASYRVHHELFLIRQDVDSVWDAYKTIHPKEAWNGDMVSFGLQYSRKQNAISYLDDGYGGMEKGQVIILHLKLFWGMIKIAVAHEVAEINEEKKSIKLCYIEGGASVGSQWISMEGTKDGFTKVTHETFYKSNSNFRDTRLYPRLHTKAITEFHNNVKRKAEALSQHANLIFQRPAE